MCRSLLALALSSVTFTCMFYLYFQFSFMPAPAIDGSVGTGIPGSVGHLMDICVDSPFLMLNCLCDKGPYPDLWYFLAMLMNGHGVSIRDVCLWHNWDTTEGAWQKGGLHWVGCWATELITGLTVFQSLSYWSSWFSCYADRMWCIAQGVLDPFSTNTGECIDEVWFSWLLFLQNASQRVRILKGLARIFITSSRSLAQFCMLPKQFFIEESMLLEFQVKKRSRKEVMQPSWSV